MTMSPPRKKLGLANSEAHVVFSKIANALTMHEVQDMNPPDNELTMVLGSEKGGGVQHEYEGRDNGSRGEDVEREDGAMDDESDVNSSDDDRAEAPRAEITMAAEVPSAVARAEKTFVAMTGALADENMQDAERESEERKTDRREGEGKAHEARINKDKQNKDEVSEASDNERDDLDVVCKRDWDAEGELPKVLAAGFQSKGRSEPFRYREMVWEQRDGRWCGRWRWTEWEVYWDWQKRIEDGRERAIRAWDVGDAPQEVLLRVIECLVERVQSFAREIEEAAKSSELVPHLPGGGLGNLALVCRAWHTLIAPVLYCKLDVTDKALQFPLRKSLAQHTRRIWVRSHRPSLSSTTAAKLGLRPSPALYLELVRPYHKEAREHAPYHPSHAIICAQVHCSYSNVVRLDLQCCTFLSSTDLLRLLASFSALQEVHLSFVTVRHVSDSLVWRGRQSVSRLRYIFVDHGCMPGNLPFISRSWAWPRRPAHHQLPAFHGLHSVELQLVARICGALQMNQAEGNARYYLDAMDDTNRAWVTSVCFCYEPYVEFHARQDDPHEGAAHIHHCLFRVGTHGAAQTLVKVLATLGIPGFVFLQTVVLETGDSVEPDDVQSLIEALHKVCTVEVRHRTCDEAHKVALQAKKSPSRSSSAGLLSPFWCLKKPGWVWDSTLSREYWKSLKDEDKEGWDPLRPPVPTAASSS